MNAKQAVAQRIIDLCTEYEIAVNSLANQAGISPSTIYSMLNEKSQNLFQRQYHSFSESQYIDSDVERADYDHCYDNAHNKNGKRLSYIVYVNIDA